MSQLPPSKLAASPIGRMMLMLRERFGIKTFIEGGTFRGQTAAWAAKFFPTVHTIEASPELHRAYLNAGPHPKEIVSHLGSTTDVLPKIVPQLAGPSLFWLDSHYSGAGTFGRESECPLLREIELIQASPFRHFVFVDDARLFLSPPPRPHALEQWPDLLATTLALAGVNRDSFVGMLSDVFFAVPPEARAATAQFCQDTNTNELPPGATCWPKRMFGWLATRG